MTPDRWSLVQRLCHAALERAASERAAFLAEACAGDAELRREVESLLAHEGTAEGFLAAPTLEAAAQGMAKASLAFTAGSARRSSRCWSARG